MFTLRNQNFVLLLAQSFSGEVLFKEQSPFNKLMTSITKEPESLPDLLAQFDKDVRHEGYMSAMEQELTTILRTRLSFVRNTVTATIEDIFTEVNDKVEGLVPTMGGNRIAVAQVPRLLTDELLIGLTERFKDERFDEVNLPQDAFPDMLTSDLMDILNGLDDVEIREMINEVIDSTGVSINDIYDRHFRGIFKSDYPSAGTLTAPAYIPFLYLERVIVLFLAKGFYQEPHAAVNLDLSRYNALLMTMISNVSRQVFTNIGVLKSLEKSNNKLLVTLDYEVNPTYPTIVLQRKQYDLLLTIDNVTPETVVGLYKLDSIDALRFNTAEELDSKAMLFERANKAAKLEQTLRQNVVRDSRRMVALRALMEALAKLVNEEEFILPSALTPEEVIKRCRLVADEYGSFSIEHLYKFVRKVVCSGLYPDSGALVYLEAMDRHQRENPDLAPREAATLAMCDMQCEWSVNQLL